MALPDPHSGLVIRYSYLWRSEADAGRLDGKKDRPCAVVLAVKRSGDQTIVVVAPITHSPPDALGNSIEIPAQTKARLGLDDDKSWIITSELNVFSWPGPDLRPIDSGNRLSGFAYGTLSQNLTKVLLANVQSSMKAGRTKSVQRDEK